ncbi:MAG TPA: hypothetical protein VFH51_07000, partial [Myxococcota bacterium]|nr:hypothetical protein [Myxococcota bacterium]
MTTAPPEWHTLRPRRTDNDAVEPRPDTQYDEEFLVPSTHRMDNLKQRFADGDITQLLNDPRVQQCVKERVQGQAAAVAHQLKNTPVTAEEAVTRLELAARGVHNCLTTNPTLPGLPEVRKRLQRHMDSNGHLRSQIAQNPKLALAIDAVERQTLGELRQSLPLRARIDLDAHLMYPMSDEASLDDVYENAPHTWTLANVLQDHPELGETAKEAARLIAEQRELKRAGRRRDGTKPPRAEQKEACEKALRAASRQLMDHPDVHTSCGDYIRGNADVGSAELAASGDLEVVFERSQLSAADRIRVLGAVGMSNRQMMALVTRPVATTAAWPLFPMPGALLTGA